MTKHVRINIRTAANVSAIRREKRNGRDKIIVPSVTLPDDIVMNGIKYPADEIEKSFMTLNRTPAPLGHPVINGMFISASDPEGINMNWVGAHNENVHRKDGRVYLDKVIDVERANQSEKGRNLLETINKGEPIHTSTGLLCELEESDDKEYKFIARNMVFDHDAILIGEDGAATPEQGVGMMVNSNGEETKVDVVNSYFEQAERDLDWAAEMAVQAVERLERAPLLARIKGAIKDAVIGHSAQEPSTNEKDMDMDKEQFEALSAKVNGLAEAQSTMAETIANAVAAAVKPLTDNLEELKANAKAKDDAELAEHVAVIVKANILDEDEAKTLTLNAARKLAKKAAPKKAAALNGAFGTTDDADEFDGVDLNAHMEAK